jgi:hypothetical protein
MNKLEVVQPGAGAVEKPRVANGASGLLEVIARAASDPNTDVAKMERLYAMLQQENARIGEQRYNEAMAAAQAAMPNIEKLAHNNQTNSMYAKLEMLQPLVKPILEKYRFSLSFSQEKSDVPDLIRVVCEVRHSTTDGFCHVEKRWIDLARDDVGAKGNASKTKLHGQASTFTYGQRYLIGMVFNLTIGGDTDGNRGAAKKPVVDASQPVDPNVEVRKCATELWTLLKTRKVITGAEKNWQAANAWLWRTEILDAAADEAAPNLTPEKFKAVIEAVKGKPV